MLLRRPELFKSISIRKYLMCRRIHEHLQMIRYEADRWNPGLLTSNKCVLGQRLRFYSFNKEVS